MSEHVPSISALVCTRNRGHLVSETVSSILANTHPNFEFIVVDQSSNDETATALTPYLSDRRLKYLKSATVGKGTALSIGLSEARGALVALTDDDCVAPPRWLETFESIFAEHSSVAVAFCSVEAGEHNPAEGYVPAYVLDSDRLHTTKHDARNIRGLGAGLAVRRSLIDKFGGFDPLLGPGSKLHSCEDRDIAIRALLAGYQVYETASTTVTHFGFRRWAQGKEHTRRDFQGIGTVYSKFLKCGHIELAYIPAYEFVKFAVWPPIWDVICLRKPQGITRITAFVGGFLVGLRTPIDRKTLKFLDSRRNDLAY